MRLCLTGAEARLWGALGLRVCLRSPQFLINQYVFTDEIQITLIQILSLKCRLQLHLFLTDLKINKFETDVNRRDETKANNFSVQNVFIRIFYLIETFSKLVTY